LERKDQKGSATRPESALKSPIVLDEQAMNSDNIIVEREKLVKFIQSYVKKHNELPPTTLDYYKYIKLVGKGAFGKVTLG